MQPANRTSSQQRGWARRSPSTSALTTEGQFGAPAGAGVNSGYTTVFRPARTAVAAQSLGVQPWVVVACSSTAKGKFGAPAGACANSGYARVFRPTWTTVAAKSLSMRPWVVVVRRRMKKGRRPLRKPRNVWHTGTLRQGGEPNPRGLHRGSRQYEKHSGTWSALLQMLAAVGDMLGSFDRT